jgi:hypothetical protein
VETIPEGQAGAQGLPLGLRLRKLLAEDDRKAVFGKTERTV